VEVGKESESRVIKNMIVTCECGFEIPITSDASTVGSIIDAHIEEHLKDIRNPQKAIAASKRLHGHIFRQLFEVVADI